MEADRRRRFGTVIARKRADGSVGSWLARYESPLDPSRRVQRSFRTSEDAQAWLNGEEMLVNLHRRGIQKWVHPTARSRRARASLMKFDELAAWAGGMRIGEVCALTVDDFDFGARTMSVNHSVCRGDQDSGPLRLGPVKSDHSKRVCVLPDLLVPLIREHIRTRRDQSSPYVFQGKRSMILPPQTLGNHFRRAREVAGCPTATFRTLRVTHTTLLMQSGGTIREAMDSIGDSTQEVVVRHYTRTVPEHQRQVVNRMTGGMVSGSVGLQRILDVHAADGSFEGRDPADSDLGRKLSLILGILSPLAGSGS